MFPCITILTYWSNVLSRELTAPMFATFVWNTEYEMFEAVDIQCLN
jgi:hypothetical protein